MGIISRTRYGAVLILLPALGNGRQGMGNLQLALQRGGWGPFVVANS